MSQNSINRVLSSYKERHCLKEIAAKMDISYTSLARILNEEDAYDLGVIKIIQFIEATNYDFALLDHIETRLGRTASPTQKKQKENISFEFSHISSLFSASNAAINELLKSIEDGIIDSKEAKRCIADLVGLIQVAVKLVSRLKLIERSSKATKISRNSPLPDRNNLKI